MSVGEGAQDAKQDLPEEDAGRANVYALIGRLLYDAPDSILLAELCRADAGATETEEPAGPWRTLQEACRTAYPVVVKQEYDTLFVGVGRSQVTPYTSHYIRSNSPDRHLVRLREQLDRWQLARRSAASEVEDHVSGICDVMRLLIVESHDLNEQRLFFNEFVYPGVVAFCEAVSTAESAVFYKHVARFARAFLEVEREAFEMQDSEA